MREYAKVAPQFWTGTTGKHIRALGPECQVIAIYLVTCPTANAFGLYYLPLPVLSHETGIPLKGALKALRRLSEVGFCRYDESSECVFVPRMASFQIGDRLKAKDNRVVWIRKEVESLRRYVFFADFLALYRDVYDLQDVSPLEAPCDPLRSIEIEHEMKIEKEIEKEIDPDGVRGTPSVGASRGDNRSLALIPDSDRSVDQPESLARLWNEVAPDLPPARIPLGGQVRKHARVQLKKEPSLEKWREIFERANRSPLLRGEKTDFHATFSWAMEASKNFAEKVLEGRWDASAKFSNGNGAGSHGEEKFERIKRVGGEA